MSGEGAALEEADVARHGLLLAVLLGLIMLLITANGWIAEDAFITLRTAANVLAGEGPRWNVGERVMTYTHPLWMGVLTAALALTTNTWAVTLLPSLACTLGALWLATFRISRSGLASALTLVVLGMSQGFRDFSTSGLENPLTHLLLAAYCALLARPVRTRRTLLLSMLCVSLLALNRVDTVLLVAPSSLLLLVKARRDGVPVWDISTVVAIASVPFTAWMVFQVVYYGTPVPNTAYAKLASGVTADELIKHGLLYLLDSLERDPVTILGLMGALVLVSWERRKMPVALGLGVVSYLAYVVWIGGDFMRGRFFAAPLFLALLSASRTAVNAPSAIPTRLFLMVIAIWLGQSRCLASVFLHGEANPEKHWGIVDERRVFAPYTAIGAFDPTTEVPRHPWLDHGLSLRSGRRRRVAPVLQPGLFGYGAGVRGHLIDPHGLTDPFLARLPIPRGSPYRIGHYQRPVPQGYEESIRSGRCTMRPALCELYRPIALITRGPIWSWERFVAMWKLHSGAFTAHLRSYEVLHHSAQELDLDQVPDQTPRATLPDPAKDIEIAATGLTLRAPGGHRNQTLTLTLAHEGPSLMRAAHFDIELFRGDDLLATKAITLPPTPLGKVRRIRIAESERQFDRIHIQPADRLEKRWLMAIDLAP